MYGLEGVHLTKAMARTLDVFQLKGYRKIFRMVTTYVDRRNTNQRVMKRVQEEMNRNRADTPYQA
eukprot:710870-Prorocentrum_lima.AAC.1